jgi:hypothetical protein
MVAVRDRHGPESCGKDFDEFARQIGLNLMGHPEDYITRLRNCIEDRLFDMKEYLNIKHGRARPYVYLPSEDPREYRKGVSHIILIKVMFDLLKKINAYRPLFTKLAETGAQVIYNQVDGSLVRHQFSYTYKRIIKGPPRVETPIILPFTNFAIDYSYIYDNINLDENWDSRDNLALLSRDEEEWSLFDPIFNVYDNAKKEGFQDQLLISIKKYLLGYSTAEDPQVVLGDLIRQKDEQRKQELVRLRASLLSQKEFERLSNIIPDLTDSQLLQIYNSLYDEAKDYYNNDISENSTLWYVENMRRLGDRQQIPKKKKSIRKGKKKSVRSARKAKKSIRKNKKKSVRKGKK